MPKVVKTIESVHLTTAIKVSSIKGDVLRAFNTEANMQGIPWQAFDAIQNKLEEVFTNE